MVMKVLIQMIFVLFLFMNYGCGKNQINQTRNLSAAKMPEGVVIGKTTTNELLSKMGKTKNNYTNENGTTIYDFGENGSYQFSNEDKLESFMRPPIAVEKHLQYWRHKFENAIIELSDTPFKSIHQKKEKFLNAPKLGIGIVYDQETSVVIKVVEYGH
jgi:hypothetical protein